MDSSMRKLLSMIALRSVRNFHKINPDVRPTVLYSRNYVFQNFSSCLRMRTSQQFYRCFCKHAYQNQHNKVTVNKSTDDAIADVKSTEINPEITSKEVAVKEKRKIIVPQLSEPEEETDTLPDHDTKRITPESRRLSLKASSLFDDLAIQRGVTKEVFQLAAQKYISKETLYRRGAVEFIYAGMHEMKRFGVDRDLACYKALLQAFPEGKMIPRNTWQVEFMHYPRQQQCGIDLLEMMEQNAVIPDKEFGRLLRNRFGNEAHVTRKYRRIVYWLPKFKNMNPYPMPFDMPVDPIELALMALKRMSVDRETKFKVWKTADMMDNPDEDTFIVSAQSRTQQRLLQEHNADSPLFVEGPFHVISRLVKQSYFLLRAEPNINALMKQKQVEKEEDDEDNLFEWKNFFEEEHYSELCPVLSVHEQDDSTILGLCITGTSSKASVVNWVRCLEKDNPKLGQTPILFQLISPSENEVQTIGDNRQMKDDDKKES